MGAHTLIPFGVAENKAFNVFMRKYMKLHQDQDEYECSLNGTKAWGKLTPEQKMLFAVRPRACPEKKRGRVPRKKKAGKQKRAVGRPSLKINGKKNLTKTKLCKSCKPSKPIDSTRRCK